jgi:hypothetical protein
MTRTRNADRHHCAMINEDAPIPVRGVVDDDAPVVIDKAPYPNNGEARSAAVEATGEDGEGGASVVPSTTVTPEATGEDGEGGALVVPTTTMTTATKGGGMNKDANAIIEELY